MFSIATRMDLAEFGVSPDTEFTMNISANGNISVQCNDPLAKEKIEKYLIENPDVCEQFGYIQALANLDRAKQSPAGAYPAWQNMRNTKLSIQAEAVEMFFGDALNSGMNFSSMLASFGVGGGSAKYYAGVDYKV